MLVNWLELTITQEDTGKQLLLHQMLDNPRFY
jgi:hypothetical protein